jgi:ABC-type sugar transport system ATPase subunit
MTLADKIVVFKAREGMQGGAPMELFEWPANEFVTVFLGSPKIHFP